MASLDELIGELRAAGELDSTGEFSLDRERAREKMRHFQLADPRSYVLELIQAAALAGATAVRIRIDADDTHIDFDGRPFTSEDFDQLYSAMFRRRDRPGAAALRQLAIGLNAAMALDPRHVRVRSGPAFMEMRNEGDDEVRESEEPVQGTRIHVKDRFGSRTVTRFYRKLRGELAEVVYLKERCRHAALPIYLADRRISGRPALPDVLARVEVTEPGLEAQVKVVAGFLDPQLRAARLEIIKEGVRITRHELDDLPPDFVACVECADLEKDVSQRDIVRDQAYDRVVDVVRGAFPSALERLAGLARESLAKEVTSLYRRTLFHPATLPLMEELAIALHLPEAERPRTVARAREIASVRLWSPARGPTPLTLCDLLEIAARNGRVGWAARRYRELPEAPGDQPPVAVISSPRERAGLDEILGPGFYDAGADLDRQLVLVRNEARWRLRRMAPEVPVPRESKVAVPLATGEVTGEVAIFLDPLEAYGGSPLWLIREGGLLEKRLAKLLVPGLGAALEAEFSPSELFTEVVVDELYVRAVLAVARALEELMVVLAHERPAGHRSCLAAYLGLAWEGDGLRQFLESMGITSAEHHALAREYVAKLPLPKSITRGDVELEDPPPLAELPLFETLEGNSVSLRECAATLRRDDGLPYLARSDYDEDHEWKKTILLLDDDELRALRRIFGRQSLKSCKSAYEWELARARHLRQRPVKMSYQGTIEAELETEDGVRGRICLRYPDPGRPVTASLRLLKYDRHLDEIKLDVPLGPISGVINDDDLTPTADWTGAKNDGRLERIRRLVVEQAAKLLVRLCDPDDEATKSVGRPYVRVLLLAAATRVLTEAADEPWAGELVSALNRAALFTNLRGEGVDLTTIREVLRRRGHLDFRLIEGGIEPSLFWDDASDPEVLLLTQADYAVLSKILGPEVLDPVREGSPLLEEAPEAVDEPPGPVEEKPDPRRLAVPALPPDPPETALVSRRASSRGGLEAHLWLPSEPSAELLVDFAHEGRQLWRGPVSELFPCSGVVRGSSLVRTRAVTARQRLGLERQAFRLYEWLAKTLFEPRRGRELQGARARAARRLLENAAAALGRRCATSTRSLEPAHLELFYYLDRALVLPPVPRGEDLRLPEPPPPEDAVPARRLPDPASPPIPEVARETRLLKALQTEMQWARDQHPYVLDDLSLDRMRFDDLDREAIALCRTSGVAINRRQPLVRALLDQSELDPALVAFLASSVYTALNHFWQEVEDDHEREFHRELVATLVARGLAGWPSSLEVDDDDAQAL